MMTIAKRRVAKSNMMTIPITMSKRINTVAKTISSIGMVKSFSISFRLSLTLGNMDNSSRDGSRCSTMDTYSVGNIGNTLDSMVDRDSMDSMVDRGSMDNMVASIAKMSKMMPSIAVQSV